MFPQCDYLTKKFIVGEQSSAPGENEGSCKIFSFARLIGIEKDPIEV